MQQYIDYYFNAYPARQVVHITADGTTFSYTPDAAMHARGLTDTSITTITRQQWQQGVGLAKEQVEPDAGQQAEPDAGQQAEPTAAKQLEHKPKAIRAKKP
ncbi:MAG TPA: hypothetical protein PKD90_08625 [Phnomibacter sp.]|nr:hypothetical protein [Phnomibacter sp.]